MGERRANGLRAVCCLTPVPGTLPLGRDVRRGGWLPAPIITPGLGEMFPGVEKGVKIVGDDDLMEGGALHLLPKLAAEGGPADTAETLWHRLDQDHLSAPYLSGTEAREASHGQWHRWSQWTHGHLCRDWYQPLFPDLAPHKRLHPGRGSSRTGWGSSPPQHPPPMKLAVVGSVHDRLSFLPPAFSYQHCTEKKLFLMVHVVLGVCI